MNEPNEMRKLVACVLVTCERRVLLLQRAASDAHPLAWQLPGGDVEKHEGPSEAAIRELFEETGIRTDAAHITVLRPIDTDDDGGCEVYRYWLRLSAFPQIVAEKGVGHAWFDPNEAIVLRQTLGPVKETIDDWTSTL